MTEATYTSTLNAGYGMNAEIQILLDLWHPDMSTTDLHRQALASGLFPNMSARRLKNLIVEGFAPCYLCEDGAPARLLRRGLQVLDRQEIEQLMFLYTCRTHAILADFVREVYWSLYAAGRETLNSEDARAFVEGAVRDNKTKTQWSIGTIHRVASYLTSYCADFGLLERGTKSERRILTYRIEPRVAAILAYDLHLTGHGDNAILVHPDWGLFGLERADVLEEMKQLALRNLLIVQSAGGVTKVSWQCDGMEELINVLTRNEL